MGRWLLGLAREGSEALWTWGSGKNYKRIVMLRIFRACKYWWIRVPEHTDIVFLEIKKYQKLDIAFNKANGGYSPAILLSRYSSSSNIREQPTLRISLPSYTWWMRS